MIDKKMRKILLILITFISACFYLIGNSIGDSIQVISGRKPAELKIKVNKKKSSLEEMYIDKNSKKIFYFFGSEGLIGGDFINVVEKPSDPSFISKTVSKISKNSSEIRVINREENKNIRYAVKKGIIKNRVIANYSQEPKNLYVEFYDRSQKLKKIVKNDYKEINIESLYGDFDEKNQEIKIKFSETDLSENRLKESVEIFSYGAGYESENLNYSVEKENSNDDVLKIKITKKSDNIYLAVFNEQKVLKRMYSVKVRVINLKNIEEVGASIVWNNPVIDLTLWDRKNMPVLKRRINTDVRYGEEILHGGTVLPYVDIKMGAVSIPVGATENKISVTPTNSERTAGNVILSNTKGEKISGRVYLTTSSSSAKKPIKGINFEDIENSTSVAIFGANEEKNADIYLRVYDSEKNLKSLFIAGKLRYIKGFNSTFSIDIEDSMVVTKVERLPEINIADLRDELKENIKIRKNVLNLSEEVGKNVGGDIIWDRDKKYVDIKLVEIKLDNFKDETGKIKNSYAEIKTLNGIPNILLQSGETKIKPERYYLRVKNGFTSERDGIEYSNKKIGYRRVGTVSTNGDVGGIDADVIVRVTKDNFISLKNSVTDTLDIKNDDLSGEKIDVIFNADYLDRKLSIPYTPFKILRTDSDRQNNEIRVNGTIFFNELPEKNLNLVFDNKKNSNGRIGSRGISQSINENLKEIQGNSVFNMSGGAISREYKDSDILTLGHGAQGITDFVMTTAKPTIDGYKSATFKSQNMDFELKIWNNTDKLELVVKKIGKSTEGAIVGIIEDRDESGNLQNKIILNLYSSTKKIGMASDIMRVWRIYENSTEWNTEVEKVNTTTFTGNVPNIYDEGGFTHLNNSFLSYAGDTVTLEPIRGRGAEGVEEKAVKLSTFTSTDKNFGVVSNGKLTFDETGRGSAKVELMLTRGMIESFFPLNKEHVDFQEIQVAEIVFGNGKRRVPVTAKIQLAQLTPESNSAFPVRVLSEYKKDKYYGTGFYEKTSTVVLKDITPGSSRDIYTIIPGTTTSGVIENMGGSKTFKGKNLTTDVYVEVGATGELDSAGIYLKDVILSNSSERFGVFTLQGGSKDIKEQEIWISKYSPVKEMQSLQSDFQSDVSGEAKRYNKSIDFARYDEEDSQTSLGLKRELGKILLLGVSDERATEIKRNSGSLNKAKLPSRIKLIPKGIVAGAVITGHLSFKENEIVTEVEQKQGKNEEHTIYLLIPPDETNKLIPEEEYEVKGEYDPRRVSKGAVMTSNLLYYGLNTDNTSDLGLGEEIYEPIFNMNIRFKVNQRRLLKIDLADRARKALVKSHGLEKNMRFYKNDGKYTIGLIGPSNYANINVVGSIEPYLPSVGTATQILRVTDLSNGRVVAGEIGEVNGGVTLETDLADLNIFYSNRIDLTIGMNAKNPLEILNIGVLKYKFKQGEIKLLVEHIDAIDSTKIISSNEVVIKIPKFYPKDWYLSENSFGKNASKILLPLKYFSENHLVFELGEVILKDIDTELMKDAEDNEGIRVEYDKDIVLEKSDDSTVKINGKIVLLDSQGDKLPDKNIETSGRLALVIDKTQSGYDLNSSYIYKGGDTSLNEFKLNKPVRIGRDGYWSSLIEEIQINSVQTDGSYSFLWNSGAVDISEWQRKNNTRSFNLNKEFVYGEESVHGGVKIPYIDIKMGDIFILKEDSADTIRLKSLSNSDKVGSVLLSKQNGNTISGSLYLKTEAGGGENPVKGYDNSNIEDSYSKIIFGSDENKGAEVRLRVYDSEKTKESLFQPEVLEYIENIYSTIGIEIISGTTVKKTDYSLPKVEFIDLRDTLKEKISFNKIILNFSEESGKNIGDNVVWTLGNRFVDIKLGTFIIENLIDKTGKLKNSYLMIDTKDDIPDISLDPSHDGIRPYRYYLKTKQGFVEEQDRINHANIGIGHSRILSKSKNGNISEINGEIFMRLEKEEFEKIKSNPEKGFTLNKSDGTSAELKIIFNEDYPEKVVAVPYGEFKTLKEDQDKENQNVALNAFIYPKEIRESQLNLIFDSKKNRTGNVGIRGTGSRIEDTHYEINGYTVFDMPKGILQNQYKDSDVIEVGNGGITNATNIEVTSAKFSVDGYKSVRFRGDNGIQYELKIWNNTDKIEITMDKSNLIENSMKHVGVVELKTVDGKVLNRINLNIYVHMREIEGAIKKTLRDGVHNGNLGVEKRYSYSNEWNTEVEVVEYGQRTTDRQVGIENNVSNLMMSYDGDRIYVEPTKGVGKEGIDGRWIELLEFTSTIDQVGTVSNNRLEFTPNWEGNARLKVTLPKSWVENRWPNNAAKGHDSFEGLELIYGNGKRRVPLKIINLQNTDAELDGKIKADISIKEGEKEVLLAIFVNRNVGLRVKRKGIMDSGFVEIGEINIVQPIGKNDWPIKPLQFRDKKLKKSVVLDVKKNNYGTLAVKFKDVPLLKEDALIGDYTADRVRGPHEGLNYYTISFSRYSPIEEAYSLTSSLTPNPDGTSKVNEKTIELYRENIEDRETTLGIIRELGSVSLIGIDETKSSFVLRSSKNLNIAKLPNKIRLKRVENGIITKVINGSLSFDITKETLEFSQKRNKDSEVKVYLKIEQKDAKNLDDKGIYVVEAEYDAGRISEDKMITDNVMYLGLKTDNTADLGLNEYIYEPIFKLNFTAALIQDNSVKLSLFRNGDQKPIPKVDGIQGLVRLYKNTAQYSPEINAEGYGAILLKGYMTPYNYDREDLKENHILRVTDEITNTKAQEMITSAIGGQVDITTPLGIFKVGYSSDKSIGSGIEAKHPMEITTVGVKKYNFKRGDVRLLLEHLDPANNTLSIHSETLIVGVPKFEPKPWYFNESNKGKLTNTGTKYMKYFNKNKIIYILGTVGLNQLRDREITKGDDDPIGVRIEYDRNIELEDKLNSSKKINAKIIKLDSNGNILEDGHIIESEVILGLEIDTSQAGYESKKVYSLKGDVSNTVDSEIDNKPIRIGRKNHWESLVTDIQLRPVMKGDLTLNVTKNYFRDTVITFDGDGVPIVGNGITLTIQGDFIKNIPHEGEVKIYKWKSEEEPYGDILAEGIIAGGELTAPLDIHSKTGDKSNYRMKISKISDSTMELLVSYWGKDILREKMFIEISDGNGATSIHRFGINIVENTSMLQIDYVNAFDPEYEFAPGESITEAVGNSLYMGTILNPKSFNHQNQRPQLESVNSLKISYVGEDVGLVNAIESIKLDERGLELRDTVTNKAIEIEDITFHRISKRYSNEGGSSAFFEEIYKLKGYIDLRKYLDLSNGHYRGTVRLEINLN